MSAFQNNPWSEEKCFPAASREPHHEISYCPVCGKGFRGVYRKYNIKKHLTIHSGVKDFKCPYCPHITNKKGNLKTHVMTVHQLPFDDPVTGGLKCDARMDSAFTTFRSEDISLLSGSLDVSGSSQPKTGTNTPGSVIHDTTVFSNTSRPKTQNMPSSLGSSSTSITQGCMQESFTPTSLSGTPPINTSFKDVYSQKSVEVPAPALSPTSSI